MKILSVYKKAITDNVEISSIIDDNIFIEVIDQNTTRTHVLLQLPEQGRDYSHDGPVCVRDGHLVVTVRADTDQKASELGDLIEDLLSTWVGIEYDCEVMLTQHFNTKSNFDRKAEVFEHISEYTSFFRKVAP